MKLLLDENIPTQLKNDLMEYNAFTITDMRWNGVKNGELIGVINNNNFDFFISFDTNLKFQQNIKSFNFHFIVIKAKDNTYNTIKKLLPKIKYILNKSIKPRITEISIGKQKRHDNKKQM